MSTTSKHNITKRSIRKRMLRFAADYMKVRNPDLLDPIVTLFIESLSEEVYKLSEDISNIEYRMLNTLLGMLTFDMSLSAQPAHCIVHAISDEKECELNKEISFTLRDKNFISKEKANLSFYPVCNTRLINGSIKYTVHNGLFYQIDKDQTKNLISRSRDRDFIEGHSFWIALDLNEEISSLDNISFFFDFPGISNKEDSLQMLSLMNWVLSDRKLDTYYGLYNAKNKQEENIVELFKKFEMSESIDTSILNIYNKHFRTITSTENIPLQKKVIPEKLVNHFPDHFVNDLNQPLLWIEVEYPPTFRPEIIEIMTVSINAFPVANKTLYSKAIKVNKSLPVVALETGTHESLLSVHSVNDASDINYCELPFDNTIDNTYRTYALRRGGYERYSTRDVKEYLDIFINSLENHSSIKSGNIVGESNMDQSLVLVHNLIKHLKKVIIKTNENLEVQNYLLLDLPNKEDIFFVKYWTTSCELANNIKQQTALDCTSSEIMINDIYLLTNTEGGKYTPKGIKQQNLRLQSLTNRTVLITNEDIIDFCKNELRNLITDVKISKGIQEVFSINEQGFVLTTDIKLIISKQTRSFIEDKKIQLLKELLQEKSPKTINYRIFIENEN